MRTRRESQQRTPGRTRITHRMMIASLLAVLIAVRLGGGVGPASAAPSECVVAAITLTEARAEYAVSCSAQARVDCDPVDGLWFCSSHVIGDNAPAGVTAPAPEVPPTSDVVEPESDAACVASALGLADARAAYAESCSEPRVDCDQLDGLWLCSSQVIGDAAPGGGVTSPVPPTATPVIPTPVPPTPVPVVPTPVPPATPVVPTPVPPTATPVVPTPVVPTPVPPTATPVVPTPVVPTPVPPTATPVPPTPGPGDLHPDIIKVISVEGRNPGGAGWADSYSVGDQCFCASTFDHNIGGIEVQTPDGTKTVREVCREIGPGPGQVGRPIYNDINCGNGPANDAGDEDDCPGRVDIGRQGCGQIGPEWDLSVFD